MNKTTLIANVASRIRTTRYKAEKALNTVLDAIKNALGQGREVDLGEKLGRLKVVERKPKRIIQNNLKCGPTVLDVHKKHRKSVRLLGRKRDLSEDPKPTVVTKEEKSEVKQVNQPVRKSFAIAYPAWRRRYRR